MDDTQKILNGLATASGALAAVPGPVGIAGKIAAVAFSSAAAFARAGKDPVVEIKRIHAADPLVRQVHERWNDELDNKFPREDIYE